VRGAQLYRLLDGTVIELASTDAAHAAWVAQDQQVLGFINTSISCEVLGHVAICTTAAVVWMELRSMFASQSRAQTIQLQTRLATTRKGMCRQLSTTIR
jgi:high-affinity nickel permease